MFDIMVRISELGEDTDVDQTEFLLAGWRPEVEGFHPFGGDRGDERGVRVGLAREWPVCVQVWDGVLDWDGGLDHCCC